VKHGSYPWTQFAKASFKNWGLFWSEFSACCGKLSPTQYTEEQGAEQIASLHFSAEKLG